MREHGHSPHVGAAVPVGGTPSSAHLLVFQGSLHKHQRSLKFAEYQHSVVGAGRKSLGGWM